MNRIFRILAYILATVVGCYIGISLGISFVWLYIIPMPERNPPFVAVPIYDQTKEINGIGTLILYDPIRKTTLNPFTHKDEVLFINVWTTWCAPCIAEMPSISLLKKDLGDTPVKFVLISDEPQEIVEKFAKKKSALNLDFYVLRGKLPTEIQGNNIPRTYILHNNRIVYQHTGSTDWNTAEIKTFIKKLPINNNKLTAK